MVYSPPVKDESTFKFPEMVKFHLLYAEHIINFGKEYEVIGSVAEQNVESSHKTFNELKRRFACIRGEQKGESILKCFNLTLPDNVASAIEEIEERSSAPYRRAKVYKKKEQTRPETQKPAQRFSDLVDNSNSEEISEVNIYDIGTKFATLNTKIDKCVLRDVNELIELLLPLHRNQCHNITLYLL